MVIASRMEGRLRVKDDLLRASSACEAVERALRALSGVREVSVNPRTGSLLVIHERIPSVQKQVMETLDLCLNSDEKSPPAHWLSEAASALSSRLCALPFTSVAERRRLIAFGLLGSFAATLLGAVLDMKKFHIVSGIGMAVFVGLHLSDKKRFFLPRQRK